MKIQITRRRISSCSALLLICATWFVIGWIARSVQFGPEVILIESARQRLLTEHPGQVPSSRELTYAAIRGMLQEVDDSMKILEDLKNTLKPEKPLMVAPEKLKKSIGIGVVEAPRGTLYHHLDLDDKGIVRFANLCIPTQQNIIHLEKDIAKYVEQMLQEKKSKEEISMQVEKMIRAYDPCMSCATHFLKINWV